MEKIADSIGKEYENWKNNDIVFISSPTGSGKTYFILHILLPFFSNQNKRILYLVNRHVLKEQLKTEIETLTEDIRYNILVESYQSIEEARLYGFPYQMQYLQKLSAYDCVVCDECHYFLSDSNFNTNTIVSYNWINCVFANKIRIFLSATINNIKKCIEDTEDVNRHTKTPIYKITTKLIYDMSRYNILTYSVERNYDYIDITLFKNYEDIVDSITSSKEKWLIFVDSIASGKKFRNTLIKSLKELNTNFSEKDVVLLSSEYNNYKEENINEINSIVSKNKPNAKILLSTSVIDNGINIHDADLRNVVITADTEEEFIQMLGRKRKDGNQLHLFINELSKNHFSKRVAHIIKVQQLIDEYWKCFDEQICKKISHHPVRNTDITEQVNMELNLVNYQHAIFLLNLFCNKVKYSDIFSFMCVFNGMLYLNPLSVKQIENLKQHYLKIKKLFDTDGEDAFLKEQLRWLGKSENEIERLITELRLTEEEKHKKHVVDTLNKVNAKSLNEDEAKNLKREIKNDLLFLVNKVDDTTPQKKTVANSLQKIDRPLSSKNVDFLQKYCNIPYRLEVNNSVYTFFSIESDINTNTQEQ